MKQLLAPKNIFSAAVIGLFFCVAFWPAATHAERSPDRGLAPEKIVVAEAPKAEPKPVVVVKKPATPAPAPKKTTPAPVVAKPAPAPVPAPKAEEKVEVATVVNPATLGTNISVSSKDLPPGLTPVLVSGALSTKAGQAASVTVKTLPGAVCNIDIFVVTRTPVAWAGLGDKTADAEGLCSWKWTVKSGTKTGSWGVKIAASKDGFSDDVWTTMNVGNVH
ncbi:MAG: hypothetical protein V1821_02505 [bacterium]